MSAGKLLFLEPDSVRFWRLDSSATVRCEVLSERCVLDARVRRAFPLSHPEAYVSVEDGAGKEIGILRSLEGLDPDSRAVIDQELDRRYFTPTILEITKLWQEGGIWTFHVRTQRGEATFYVRNWRDSAHEIQPGRWQIRSIDSQRYDIRSFDDLDERSKMLLEQVF